MSVITIARQFGAGGKTLGAIMAQKLGYTLIDEEIVDLLAQEANVSSEWVDAVERKAGSEGVIARLLSRLGPYRKGYVKVATESSPGYMDGNLYIALLHKIIPRIAEQDNVVIVGRGAQYILADRPNTLHLLLIASLNYRIEFIMEQYDLDEKQAQIVVEKHAKRRLHLYSYFGRLDYEKPELYHLVMNMNRLSLDEAVALVCHLVEDHCSM